MDLLLPHPRYPPATSSALNAIAALHADARTAEETDWVQIVEWYDELVRLTDSPMARLNRAVLDPALPATPPPRRTCTSVMATHVPVSRFSVVTRVGSPSRAC